MDESMIERLRFDADRIETGDTDLDALVGGAVRQGHRRRTRRRLGAALSAGVAAVVVVTAVAAGVPAALRGGEPVTGPVAVPVTATATPAYGPTATATPSASVRPSASATPTRPAGSSVRPSTPEPAPRSAGASVRPQTPGPPTTTGRVSGTPGDVQAILVDLLPDPSAVTRAVSDRSSTTGARENSAYLDLRDARGTSQVSVAVGRGQDDDICVGDDRCTRTRTPDGGTLWITSSPPADKAGLDQYVLYDRPDGGYVSLTESTSRDGNGPVTRSELPLTAARAKALVTSPAWDGVFHG